MFRNMRLSFLNWNTRPLEAASAAALGIWGAVLLMPYATFTSNVAFYPMLALYPVEWVWGLVYLAFGLMQLAAVWKGYARVRGYIAAAASAPFMFLFVSFAYASPQGVAFLIYFLFMLCNWWAARSARTTGG